MCVWKSSYNELNWFMVGMTMSQRQVSKLQSRDTISYDSHQLVSSHAPVDKWSDHKKQVLFFSVAPASAFVRQMSASSLGK